jgi:biotin carboxylase
MEPICVIVDGYSSGKYYAEEFKKLGYRCLHIKSRDTIPVFLAGGFCSNHYDAVTTHTDEEQTLQWIRDFGIPLLVIAGCETGVNLADSLSDAFQTESRNALHLTEARRDKYLMMEAVRASGARAMRQFRTTSPEAALAWIESEGLPFPVVVKPLRSVGGEGFCFCENARDVVAAFEKILGKQNLLNIRNEAALVQEFIAGEEYVVDTVSRDGMHIVSDFIKYGKSITAEGSNIYKSCTFMPLDFPLAGVLESYAGSVLDALGIRNGPAHAEIMVDKNGPVLIETGARLAGCWDQELVHKVYGRRQGALAVMAYHDPQAFKAQCLCLEKPFYCHLELVFLSCAADGIVARINDDAVRALPSFKRIDLHVQEGAEVKRTGNLSETTAIVYLMHEDRRVIEQDRQTIFAMESEIVQILCPDGAALACSASLH